MWSEDGSFTSKVEAVDADGDGEQAEDLVLHTVAALGRVAVGARHRVAAAAGLQDGGGSGRGGDGEDSEDGLELHVDGWVFGNLKILLIKVVWEV